MYDSKENITTKAFRQENGVGKIWWYLLIINISNDHCEYNPFLENLDTVN